jgi:predicted HAD superfamily Cof-like phosphohydrolase
MKKHINQVRQFHTAFCVPVHEEPFFPITERMAMRHNILCEEVVELETAMARRDMVEVADAITDCVYILFGTALELGIADKLPACFDEVHRSNMTKLEDGQPLFRADGKILKGRDYERPDLKTIIEQ